MRDPILAKLPITVPASQRRLKIAYLSGPSDAPAAYRKWSEGSLREYFGTDYMSQFLQVGEELGSEIYVITTLGGKYSLVREGRFIFEIARTPRA